MNTLIQGALTEQKCFLKCIELGYTVSKPLFDNARYDFILDVCGKLYRIQVKTSHWIDEAETAFAFNGYSQHSLNGSNKRMKYTNKEIDFFMTEQKGIFYLYPASEQGFVEKRLRIKPAPNGQIKNITFAKNYEIEEVLKNL